MRSIHIANRHPRLRLDRRAVARVIHLLDTHAGEFTGACPPGELSLVFMTDAALAQLHADFLDDPTVTDVITFEGDPAPAGLPPEAGTGGEICVSADAAVRQAGADAFSDELTLYIVHGWLHLAGYDDLQPAKKRLMRRAEAKAIKLLRAHDYMPRFILRAR